MNFNGGLFSGAKWLLLSVAAVLSGCATQPTVHPDEILPMYGQPGVVRSEEQKRTDEDFIKQAAASFSGSRERASMALWREGDAQMNRGNLGFAMKYYNQSWLLNPNNYLPYWGFARAMLDYDKIDDSIKYFEMARKLCNDDYQRPGILSDAGAAYSYKANGISEGKKERAQYFALANGLFVESTKLEPKYMNSWKQWAFSLYREGNYSASWEKINKARALGATNLDVFIGNLEKKMPEPK